MLIFYVIYIYTKLNFTFHNNQNYINTKSIHYVLFNVLFNILYLVYPEKTWGMKGANHSSLFKSEQTKAITR
jgi:hypothetical protein